MPIDLFALRATTRSDKAAVVAGKLSAARLTSSAAHFGRQFISGANGGGGGRILKKIVPNAAVGGRQSASGGDNLGICVCVCGNARKLKSSVVMRTA